MTVYTENISLDILKWFGTIGFLHHGRIENMTCITITPDYCKNAFCVKGIQYNAQNKESNDYCYPLLHRPTLKTKAQFMPTPDVLTIVKYPS